MVCRAVSTLVIVDRNLVNGGDCLRCSGCTSVRRFTTPVSKSFYPAFRITKCFSVSGSKNSSWDRSTQKCIGSHQLSRVVLQDLQDHTACIASNILDRQPDHSCQVTMQPSNIHSVARVLCEVNSVQLDQRQAGLTERANHLLVDSGSRQ